jgi:hypothetical protein
MDERNVISMVDYKMRNGETERAQQWFEDHIIRAIDMEIKNNPQRKLQNMSIENLKNNFGLVYKDTGAAIKNVEKPDTIKTIAFAIDRIARYEKIKNILFKNVFHWSAPGQEFAKKFIVELLLNEMEKILIPKDAPVAHIPKPVGPEQPFVVPDSEATLEKIAEGLPDTLAVSKGFPPKKDK